MPVHFKRQAQIKTQVGALLFNKVSIKVLAKYSNYSNIFLTKYIAELPKNTRINEYAIKLEEDKQPLFRPIYNLRPVKLETLKTYIKINLVNSFIRLFKSPIRAFILFDKKSNKSLRLYINYWSLYNLTIKNQYPLFLISKSLNLLGWAK